jgi:hypothetical protein
MGSQEKPAQYVIRRDAPQPMWLSREQPIAWGARERSIRYRSKGDAARKVANLHLGAVTIEPAAED